MRKILITLSLLTFIGCTQNISTDGNNSMQTDYITILTVGNARMTEEVNDPDLLAACIGWELSKDDIKEILLSSNQISATERIKDYYYIPCDIDGSIEKDGSTFTYEINAGATIKLRSQDSVYDYYGCSQSSCEQYFLMMPDELLTPEL